MANKLIVIGYIGVKKCYLNVDMDEAIERYCKSECITRVEFEEFNTSTHEYAFEDEFEAYDVWG